MRTIKYVLASAFALTLMVSCGGEKKKEEGAKKKITLQKESTKVEKKVEETVVLTDEEVTPLLTKNTCVACHKKGEKLVGPSFAEIAKRKYTDQRIVELIYKPEPENWPEYPAPMVALPFVPKGEALKIAGWINSLE